MTTSCPAGNRLEMKRHRNDDTVPSPADQGNILKHHSAVLNNIGAYLMEQGEMLNAMRVLQQSVQAMMLTEGETQGAPTTDQIEQSQNWLKRLSDNEKHDEKVLSSVQSASVTNGNVKSATEEDRLNNCKQCGIPGLFGSLPKIRNAAASSERPLLIFPKPFHVTLEGRDMQPTKKISSSKSIFRSPFHQTSKATLFNMGLIHYSWGSDDSALQFFELSISLASSTPPINPDLIILACLNNIGQMRLQTNRTTEAMGLFTDALTRGNASLALVYNDDRSSGPTSRSSSPVSTLESGSVNVAVTRSAPTPLHVFLARTLMNIGQVHFSNCDFLGSRRTWLDALRLLHPHTPAIEAAALAYNMGLLYHHQNERRHAIEQLDNFLERAYMIVGRTHLQVAAALHRKGLIFFEMGDLYASMKPLLQTLNIRTQLLGQKSGLVAETLFVIAKVLQEREEYEWASKALENCLDVRRELCKGGSDSLEVAQTLMELGRTHHARGQQQASVTAYLEAIRLTQQFFGQRHKFVARIQNIVGNLYLEQGRVAEAVVYFLDAMNIHVEQGLLIDLAVVSNALIRVELRHCPGASAA